MLWATEEQDMRALTWRCLWVWCGAWALVASSAAQTPAEVVQRVQRATLGVVTKAVEGARSIDMLGAQRAGSGVLIGRDGLVLTIGYLILEAETVDVIADGRRWPASVVAYDLASGFGLLRVLTPLRTTPVELGDPAGLEDNEPVLIMSGGEDAEASLARLVSRRSFSGYWEYHIDGALFTAPPRRDHSGAGLFNAAGELLGIGSLVVSDALGAGRPRIGGNMFVPVDLLKPILAELRTRGQSAASRRAWLGVNCTESDGVLEVVRITPDSPAEDAGLEPGDRIVAIDGVEVASLETLYKALWRQAAERDVVIGVRRGAERRDITVQTRDRNGTLRKPLGV